MSIIDQVGSSLGDFGWASMGNIVTIVVIFLAVLIFFLLVFFVMWWKSFNYTVKIYEPVGQVPMTDDEIFNFKNKTEEAKTEYLEDYKIKFDHIRYKKTHGKYTKKKGTPYFLTFMPMRKLAPINMDLKYDDGVHLLKLSRDILVPIQKPNTILKVGKNVSIAIEESVQWKVWDDLMTDQINNKYQDLDVQKKVVFYFVTGIVVMVLLGGFILWLIYSSVTKGYDAADRFNQAAQGLLGGGTPA